MTNVRKNSTKLTCEGLENRARIPYNEIVRNPLP